MRRLMCEPDGLRNYLTGDEPLLEVRGYAKEPGFKKAFIERMTRDKFDAPQCCM